MAGENTVAATCVSRTDAASGRHANARFDPHELTSAQAAAREASPRRALAAKGLSNHGPRPGLGKGEPPTVVAAAPSPPPRSHGLLPRHHRRQQTATSPDRDDRRQIDVLNAAYALSVLLARGRPITTNATWYNGLATAPRPSAKMKKALRQGANDLNIYTVRPRRRPARLGDLPAAATLEPRRRRRARPSRCPAARPRRTTWATPRPTRSATGSASTTRSRAAAPAPGDRVTDTPAEASPRLRLPDRPRHLLRARRRPDQQLHGLHRRRLHGHGAGRAGFTGCRTAWLAYRNLELGCAAMQMTHT